MQFGRGFVRIRLRADYHTRIGKYREAESYYRKAIDIQPAPRYVDPLEALAQLYQRMGCYGKAVATLEEELDVLDKEWQTAEGETADVVRREIQRLEQKSMEK